MIVEPFAEDRVEDNFNPVGRLFYCASVLLCTAGAIEQEGHMVLGGQAGEKRIREIVTAGGLPVPPGPLRRLLISSLKPARRSSIW